MSLLFLAILFTGLFLSVVVMWKGVERHDRRVPTSDSLGRELPPGIVAHWLPVVAVFALSLGFIGYWLLRTTSLDATTALLVAGGTSVVASGVAYLSMTRWILPAARRSPEDPRYALQGVPGTIVADVGALGTGMVAYSANGRTVSLRARSVDGLPLAAGSEVVIDRIEEDLFNL